MSAVTVPETSGKLKSVIALVEPSPPPPPPEGLEQAAIQRIRAVMIGKRRKLLNR
jgi:hypothetical protein